MTIEERVAPVFRKSFALSGKIKKAQLFICGLGYFELKVNGNLPDDSVLNPANTHYCQTVLYREFDVTALLNPGNNVLTVELGNGFFNETTSVWNWHIAPWRAAPQLILDLIVAYVDGTEEKIVSDESWLATLDGPILKNSIYYGETYDARRCEFTWRQAILADTPKGTLRCQDMPPIRRVAQFLPEEIRRLPDRTYIITAPEMTAGWMKMRVRAPRDTEIVITYSENLVEDGHVLRNGKHEGRNGDWWPDEYIQQDVYISDGQEGEYEPKFSYKGYKYIQVENYPGELTKEDVVLYRVANDVPVISSFSCSDETVNTLHAIMRRTLHNNFQGKPTDTPVWEKNGWMGDLNVALASAFYNYDMRGFLNCFVHSMADCQREGGVVPSMLPTPKWENENCIVWNSAFVFAVEKLHDYYGDAGFLREIYPDLRRFAQIDMEALEEGEWIWPKWDFADWVSPIGDEYGKIDALSSEGHTLCSTAYAYAMLRAMEKLARILHENDDARIYEDAAEKVREAFDRKFYNADKQIYETGEWRPSGKRTEYRQTSNLLPLSFGMASGDKRKAVAENLAKDFIAKDYHLDTGCVGTRAVLPVLFDEGYAEIAYRVLTQDTYPGWGHWIAKNGPSTGAWECWEPATRSRNHYFLGTYEEALYSHILGIRNVRDGFTHCTIAPEIECGLEFAEGSIQTVNGTVSCAWKKMDGKTIVETEVPDGTVAEVILPGIREQISGCKKEYIV